MSVGTYFLLKVSLIYWVRPFYLNGGNDIFLLHGTKYHTKFTVRNLASCTNFDLHYCCRQHCRGAQSDGLVSTATGIVQRSVALSGKIKYRDRYHHTQPELWFTASHNACPLRLFPSTSFVKNTFSATIATLKPSQMLYNPSKSTEMLENAGILPWAPCKQRGYFFFAKLYFGVPTPYVV